MIESKVCFFDSPFLACEPIVSIDYTDYAVLLTGSVFHESV